MAAGRYCKPSALTQIGLTRCKQATRRAIQKSCRKNHIQWGPHPAPSQRLVHLCLKLGCLLRVFLLQPVQLSPFLVVLQARKARREVRQAPKTGNRNSTLA